VPTPVGGAALFVYLLLPGLCYVARLERGQRPGRSSNLSVFREAVTVVISSVVALSVSAVLFAGARWLAPNHTPDIGRLVRDEHRAYIKAYYAYLGAWILVILLSATALAFLAGWKDMAGALDRKFSSDEGGRVESAWWAAFELSAAKDRKKYLTCKLDDGTQVEGGLFTYNHTPDETSDREILVSSPYYVRLASGAEERFQAGTIVVSARHIVWLRVEYLSDAELAVTNTRDPVAAT